MRIRRLADDARAGGREWNSIEATVGVGQPIKGVRVGVAGKYVEDNAPALRVSRGAVDLGVSKDFFGPYTFALAVQNIGASTSVPCATTRTCTPPPGNVVPNPTTPVWLPLRSTFGVQTQRPVGQLDLMATAAVFMLRTDWFGASGGAELGYSWLSDTASRFAPERGARCPVRPLSPRAPASTWIASRSTTPRKH